MDYLNLRQLAHQTILNLATQEGINASGKDEIYGCIFGRDSFTTILKILKASQNTRNQKLIQISRRSLLKLVSLQGQEFNIESGEQPGKFIHEYRTDKFEHLVSLSPPWYIYPDGVLKNYDSIDSTPLGLIALYRYFEVTHDQEFLMTVLPAVEKALNWIITFGDLDNDFLIEYEFPKERKYGGLVVQSWTDSHESLKKPDGSFPLYPIAPIEAQGYAWMALKLWGDFYIHHSPSFSVKLLSFAQGLKKRFNEAFLLKDQGLTYGAQALDGNKNQIKTITSNPLISLWSAFKKNGAVESIIDDKFIEDLVERAFLPDLFVEGAGMRTMSSLSQTFNPGVNSYHNGSFWPMLNGMIIEGLDNFYLSSQSKLLTQATLEALSYFGTPIELYTKIGKKYFEFENQQQKGCREQAWSAATLLDITS